MIIADDEDQLWIVTQNDHAHFAAELLSLWRRGGLPEHPRRAEILLAAREHDNGWRESDSAPRCDRESGRPLDFQTVPQDLRREIWRRGVERMADRNPFSALLVVQHAIHLHRARRSSEWSELLDEWRRHRDELLAAAGVERRALERDYRWIELSDLLSLALCSRWHREIELHGVRAEVRPPNLALDPFPLAGATTFRIPCRRIPDRPYRGDADLGGELAAARWGEAAVRVVPPTNAGSLEL
jgi:hypothetical protein